MWPSEPKYKCKWYDIDIIKDIIMIAIVTQFVYSSSIQVFFSGVCGTSHTKIGARYLPRLHLLLEMSAFHAINID